MVEETASERETELVCRKARLTDIAELLALINRFAARGIMLPRTEFELAENIRDFMVIVSRSGLVACGALHFYTAQAAEIRSLAVDSRFQKHGLGRRLVQALEQEAESYGLAGLFAFTYVPDFFRKLGYHEVDRGELPLKAWKDCLRCPKFQACDEIAMWKTLGQQAGETARLTRGTERPAGSTQQTNPVPLLPILR
ncbi:MAG: N-acetyltransferase [Bryobacteraceae bacterium]|nr:N-acetyltransferase [Bryobacteraceae bacterium]MDW8379740.1 N-acetyltransferase [Bryobacterales bacterium]